MYISFIYASTTHKFAPVPAKKKERERERENKNDQRDSPGTPFPKPLVNLP